MWLLKIDSGGGLSPIEYIGNNIPPYAILSHTWGEDGSEVTFRDMQAGAGVAKAGYRKIRFCKEQAIRDGLQYFWIDTCCIDKSSSAELTEAINSMFQYYQKSAKCYVYLSDVSARETDAFQKSRWFTRGWTLQELLAPASVEFFSVEGERLGDKESMVQAIHQRTGISIRALQGEKLSAFSVRTRIAWAEGRSTKREEDAAYCLLGIFDVYMPLIYGEGREKALMRLCEEVEKSLKSSRTVERLLMNDSHGLSASQNPTPHLRINGNTGNIRANGRVGEANTGILVEPDGKKKFIESMEAPIPTRSASVTGSTGSINAGQDAVEVNTGISIC